MFFPLIFFIAGIILRNQLYGKFLLKLNFYFLLPILILKIFSEVSFENSDLFLPIISSIIIISTFLIETIFLKINDPTKKGILLIAPMIMNLSVVYPLVILNFPEFFIKKVAFFDLANGILTLTLTYSIAIKYGSKNNKIKLKKLASPPLIAIFLGLIINLIGFSKYTFFLNPIFNIDKYLIIFTIYFSLGCFFTFDKSYLKYVALSNFFRFGIGFLFAFLSVCLFKINKIETKILFLCCMAPCGFNTLTFAVLENLDMQLAANIISISLLIYFFIAFVIFMF